MMKLRGVVKATVLLLLCWASTSMSAMLPVPQKVDIQTLNMNYVLKWDWNPDQAPASARNVSFTAQYLAMFKSKKPMSKQDWRTVCESTSEHFCDFSSHQLHYLGMWLLRLRAQSGEDVSPWVSRSFCPDRDAVLGPPSAVTVTTVKGLLQVAIADPLSITNGSMKEFVPNMYYFIEYWKKNSPTQRSNLSSTYNLVILPELESWTWYCVRVQSVYDYYKKISMFSSTYCMQTDGQIQYWQIILFFLLSLVVTFLSVMGVLKCIIHGVQIVKSIFYPSISLPASIQEYLHEPGSSDTPHLLSADPELEMCCDKVNVLSSDFKFTDLAEVILEIHLPHETSPQRGRGAPGSGSRRSSRCSSYDSGVYSTEGSGQRQNELGEVNVEKLGEKIRAEELDEGVQDVIV